MTRDRPRHVQAHFGVAGIFAADPLAMAVAVEPGIVTRSERRHVTVELAGPSTRGQTTVDWSVSGAGRRTRTWSWKSTAIGSGSS